MSTLELKPHFNPQKKNEKENPQLEKAKSFLLTLSLALGFNPRLDSKTPTLDPSQPVSDQAEKFKRQPGQELEPQPQVSHLDRAVNFMSTLGFFLAGDFSYTPEPETPTQNDPLAWKKQNAQKPTSQSSSAFFNRSAPGQTPQPAPKPAPAAKSAQQLEEERLAKFRPSLKPRLPFPSS
jgi:hypothetical protein